MATNANNTTPASSNPPAGVPWEQTLEYLMLTNRIIPPGGRTTYVVPHPVGASPTDITSFVYGQASITINTWPEFMYMLSPTPEWRAARGSPKPAQKIDHNGQPVWERYPVVGQPARALLDYKGLPDTISTHEDWWWYDIWRRLHPQSKWDDIIMRMEVPNRDADWDIHFQNAIQTDLKRKWHKHYHIVVTHWFGTGRGTAAALAPVHAALHAANIPLHLNTTRGVTPGPVFPMQPNSRMIPHPVLPMRRYQRGRPSRLSAAAQTSDSDTSGEALPDLGSEIEEDGIPKEHGASDGGEDWTVADNIPNRSPSVVSVDAVASRPRSTRRRRPRSPGSFTPINLPAPTRRRRLPAPTPVPAKPRERRVAAHKIEKKERPIGHLQRFMKQQGRNTDVNSLRDEMFAPLDQAGTDSDESQSSIRRQYRPATASNMDNEAATAPARHIVVDPAERLTTAMDHETNAEDARNGSLEEFLRNPTRHSSLFHPPSHGQQAYTATYQETVRAPFAAMYGPATSTYGTAHTTAQRYSYNNHIIQFRAASPPTMPAQPQQANDQLDTSTSDQQLAITYYGPAPPANDTSANNTSEQNFPGYGPRGSYFESADLFREYEGW